jgi:C_GCAxxG_C_C family probable redox protein
LTFDNDRQRRAFELARNKLNEGWNCGQSVLATTQEIYGLRNADVLRSATGFGGGIGNMGETCGGFAGGVMFIGQRYGRDHLSQHNNKERTYQLCAEWMRRFKSHFGSCDCCDILKVDLSNPETRKEYWSSGDNRERCANETVGRSAHLLTAYIEEIDGDD